LEAEDQFIQDMGQFPRLEQTVSDLSRKMAADFLSLVLSNTDELLRSSGRRKARYNAQRRITRTLISTVGDITFEETVFRDRKTGEYRRLLGHRRVTDPGRRWKQGFDRYETDLYTTFIPEENRFDQKRPRGCFFCAKRELNLS